MKAIIITILLLVNANYAYSANFQAWLENGTKKIRQDTTPVIRDSITIKAARNEFEPFQLVFKNTSSVARNNIDVSVSNFTGAGTIPSTNVTIFKEHFVNAPYLSTREGATGLWPDALLPKVDAYYGETRTTFPLSVDAGFVQPFWFDVFVPSNATPGDYKATVTITENSAVIYTGTVNLSVWDFELPATSSLPSWFDNGTANTWKGFSGKDFVPTSDMVQLQRIFTKSGLRHRITVAPYSISLGTWAASCVGGTGATIAACQETGGTWSGDYASISATNYNTSVAGFLDGSYNTIKLSGELPIEYGESTTTSFNIGFGSLYTKYVMTPGNICNSGTTTPPAELLYEVGKRAAKLATVIPLADRSKFYILPFDEPGATTVGCGPVNPTLDYNSSKAIADVVRTYGFKTKVTSRRKAGLLDDGVNTHWDMWAAFYPMIVGNFFVDGKSIGDYDFTPDYAADIANGAKLWWYQGCADGGCGISGTNTNSKYYDGYSHYFLDFSAMHVRIFPWMTFKYGVQGEYYYNVSGCFGAADGCAGDPYNSIWSSAYAKNGDGMLFYPGVVNTTVASLPLVKSDGTLGRGAHTPSIGGTHNIPIESIRLKMIREGREDYEYLKILKDIGDNAFVQSQVSSIVTNTHNFSTNEAQLLLVREQIANRILSLMGAPPIPVSTPPAAPKGLERVN
jgi:hypothetical protein